jgi:cytidylate kinase
LLNGKDISNEISLPEIGDLASRLSTRQMIREYLRKLQRAAGEAGAIVIEGRDIGTAIFPDAEFKFFLTAELGIRAARRFSELSASGVVTSEAEVRKQLEERDRRDQQRALAPLKQADDAIVIDSSGLDVEEVVHAMLAHIEHQSGHHQTGERKL